MAELSVDPSVSPPWSWRRLNVVFMLMALTLTGCQAEESYCYTAINARNAPRHFVVVERADEATHYVPDAEDERLTMLLYLPFPSDVDTLVFDEEGRFQFPWPSCQNVDAFDEVTDIHIREISQYNSASLTILGGDPGTCEVLSVRADTNLERIQLKFPQAQHETLYIRATLPGTYFIQSRIKSAPPSFEFISDSVISSVALSHIAESMLDPSQTNSLGGRKRADFVGEGTEGGAPPFMLMRTIRFYSEAEEQAADLYGEEEMEAAGYFCGDLYYGYFAGK